MARGTRAFATVRIDSAYTGVRPRVRIEFARLVFQHRRECSASVFGINVDAAGEDGLVANVGAGEIKAALDGKTSFIFDLLRKKFPENQLLGKVLGADDNPLGARRTTGECDSEQQYESSKSQS